MGDELLDVEEVPRTALTDAELEALWGDTSSGYLSDLYKDEEDMPEFYEETVKVAGKEFHKISMRAARLDVVNRNRRMLRKGVLGGDTTKIVVSDWGHDSLPRFSFFGWSQRKKPVGIGDLTQNGNFLDSDMLYPVELSDSMDSFNYLKIMREVIGASVTYRPITYKYQRNKDGIYVDIAKAKFVEITPDVNHFVASPGTRIMKLDTMEGFDLTDTAKAELLMMLSDEELIDALTSRGKRYGDITPFMEYMASI